MNSWLYVDIDTEIEIGVNVCADVYVCACIYTTDIYTYMYTHIYV